MASCPASWWKGVAAKALCHRHVGRRPDRDGGSGVLAGVATESVGATLTGVIERQRRLLKLYRMRAREALDKAQEAPRCRGSGGPAPCLGGIPLLAQQDPRLGARHA
jgi:hypothetical protein